MSARTWAARACLAMAGALLRSATSASADPEPEEDADDGAPLPAVAMSEEARRMLADGEHWAALLLQQQLAKKNKEPEAPLRGSMRARLEEAKARRAP